MGQGQEGLPHRMAPTEKGKDFHSVSHHSGGLGAEIGVSDEGSWHLRINGRWWLSRCPLPSVVCDLLA